MSKPIEYTKLKVNAKEIYRLLLIMMCQCMSIICNICTTLVDDVDNGGRYECMRMGYMGNLCTILSKVKLL